MRKIGIFGGTFNPIHLGHLIVAEEIRERIQLDKILFIPSARPPHKDNSKIINPVHRYKMTELAIEDNLFFDISDIELKRAGKSYTIDTIRQLKDRIYRKDDLYLIIGGDSFLDIKTWYKPEQIVRECRVIATTRPGFDVSQVAPYWQRAIKFVPVSDIAIAATEIRDDVKKGVSIRYKVPLKVEEYIRNHNLYK